MGDCASCRSELQLTDIQALLLLRDQLAQVRELFWAELARCFVRFAVALRRGRAAEPAKPAAAARRLLLGRGCRRRLALVALHLFIVSFTCSDRAKVHVSALCPSQKRNFRIVGPGDE